MRPRREHLPGLIAAVLSGCGASSVAPPEVPPGPDAGVDPSQARLVLLISVDGLRPEALTPTTMPFLEAQRARGASTLRARTDPGRTLTVPNHLCMLTGRPTDGPEGHAFTANSYVETILHEQRGFYVQSVFDVAHDRGLATALVSGKTKLGVIANAYDAAHGAPDEIGADGGRRKIDFVSEAPAGDDETLDAAIQAITELRLPALVFLHLSDPDQTGHADGFDPAPGTEYSSAARRTDERLAGLVQRLAELPALAGEPIAVVLTSDHGGTGYDHFDPTLLSNTSVPFLTWGAGVGAGDLYELNARGRRDPGETPQPGGTPPPIRNCEAGNLALSLLGLPPIAGSVFDARQDLVLRAR